VAKRNSFSHEEIGSNAKRGLAISKVHFSSIFYCSRPFAAALTRKRFQLMYTVFGLLMCLDNRFSELHIAFTGNGHHCANHFRFEFIGCKDLNSLKIRPVFGKMEFTPQAYTVENSTYNLEFHPPVCFDGWIIHTPIDLPSCSSSLVYSVFVKKDIQEIKGNPTQGWKQIDSSSKVQIADKTLFLNGSFDMTKYRGTDVQFRTSKQNVFGFILPEAIASIYLGLLGVLSFAGFAKFASKLPMYNAILFISSQIVNCTICFTSPGDYTCAFHFALAFAEFVALVLMSYEQWVNLFLWDGMFFALIACSVMGLGEDGAAVAAKFFGIGVPFVTLGIAIKALQYWTCRSARRAIQTDYATYLSIWNALQSDQASLDAIRDIEALLAWSDCSLVRLESAPTNSAKTPGKPTTPVHQEVCGRAPRAGGGFYRALVQAEESDLHSQLARLYTDAESADALFRPWVLELARHSSGLLCAAAESREARAPGGGGDGALVDGRGGVWYLRVTEQTRLEDVEWAGLKSPARSAEKVACRPASPPQSLSSPNASPLEKLSSPKLCAGRRAPSAREGSPAPPTGSAEMAGDQTLWIRRSCRNDAVELTLWIAAVDKTLWMRRCG
jgi:hypothetical protein